MRLSRNSVSGLMIAESWRKTKRAKQPPPHQMCEWRVCFCELLRIDGLEHEWFEGDRVKCTLLVCSDDSTDKVGELWFVLEKPFFGYCEILRLYFERMVYRWPSKATNMAYFGSISHVSWRPPSA
jgi:hypothetical protein